MVVVSGPEADLAQSLGALGASRPSTEAGAILEDGRLSVAAQGNQDGHRNKLLVKPPTTPACPPCHQLLTFHATWQTMISIFINN